MHRRYVNQIGIPIPKAFLIADLEFSTCILLIYMYIDNMGSLTHVAQFVFYYDAVAFILGTLRFYKISVLYSSRFILYSILSISHICL